MTPNKLSTAERTDMMSSVVRTNSNGTPACCNDNSREKLAIEGGPKTKRSPLADWPTMDEGELDSVARVVKSHRWWRNEGSEVDRFEEEFAKYHNVRRALGVTNGTQAIEIALQALGIGEGDEVIVPAFTWISTATAVLLVGAVPIMADVDAGTYCLDPESVERAITPRTKAIIPVHMAGQSVDMDALSAIADEHKLVIIEDAAHAHGSEWKGQRVGALHTCGIFSFQNYKLMTAGEGGMIVSNDEDFMERCFLYSNCGRVRGDRDYQHVVLGTNARMSELHGAMLRVQQSRLDDQIARRHPNAMRLDALLADVPGITTQTCDSRVTRHPHYMAMFRYDPSTFAGLPRRQFVAQLVAEGFPAYVAYPAIHRLPIFDKNDFGPKWARSANLLPTYRDVQCPVSVEIGENVVWLHHRLLLGDEADLTELITAIEKIRYHATT